MAPMFSDIDASRIPTKGYTIIFVFFCLVILAIIFQIGHFAEHLIQVFAWIFGERMMPYMTGIGMWLMNLLGQTFFPYESEARQYALGFESLHLVGNLIYVFGTLGLWYFIRGKTRMIANAFQVFHVLEHISLTASFDFLNTAVVMSTLYGIPMEHMTSVAYRVWWHFFANAIPTAIVLFVLYAVYKRNKLSVRQPD